MQRGIPYAGALPRLAGARLQARGPAVLVTKRQLTHTRKQRTLGPLRSTATFCRSCRPTSGACIGQLDRTARTAPDSFGQQTAGQQTQRQSPSATRQPLRALYVVSWRGLAWYTQDEHPPSCCNECGPLSIASIDRELIELARSRAAPGAGSAGPALTQLVTCACCRGVASYTSLHT